MLFSESQPQKDIHDKMKQSLLDRPVTYLKGVGPKKGEMLNKELSIFTFGDLLRHFPYRYVDKTQFHAINSIQEEGSMVQLRGVLRSLTVAGGGRKRRLVGRLRDGTGSIELVWFKGIHWLEKQLVVGQEYIAYGRVSEFNKRFNIPHPEMEVYDPQKVKQASTFAPIYSSTEKLNAKGLDAKGMRKCQRNLIAQLTAEEVPESLPEYLLKKLKFPPRYDALCWIHFPQNQAQLQTARRRLIFEELFYMQLRLLRSRYQRKKAIKGFTFGQVGDYFHDFYKNCLPFNLTGAQKRVVKEIRKDLGQGRQMNRLLQGDVGSGKTMVALLTSLIALDNGYQTCLMAPTEILAQQHYQSLSNYLQDMDVQVDFLSGSVKGKKRKAVLEDLVEGRTHIITGTHALLEDPVVFKNLGLAIIDEQHRFGVKQRARLWKKSQPFPPHVLVMTATPIPRTLAMTLYGDLDVSVIDELPPGRKPVKTLHRTENHRLRVFGFMREQITLGHQVYVVYPLIEESETLELKNLEEGYEALSREFPPPDYQISVVHGRMKPADKDAEMARFARGETQIMVATTVIEVGVNVPNASVMVIENTERFGLSQLHQLRGRVGRGADQAYCILLSSFKLSKEGRQRIDTMVRTTDGFEIAEADLRLRGPGNIEGTQQSGIINLHIADLARDGKMLATAREIAQRILDDDPELQAPHHQRVQTQLQKQGKQKMGWGLIS
ncbi:MAG TPA: ATP-dependent DNA helicase RecG [Saprospiraceae bacterium]|nr:ATP-dependent DNA helicase RecG [Saprospiraceae bacterium]